MSSTFRVFLYYDCHVRLSFFSVHLKKHFNTLVAFKRRPIMLIFQLHIFVLLE